MRVAKQFIEKQITALPNLRFLINSGSRIIQINCPVHPFQLSLSNLLKFSIIPIILSEFLHEIVKI